MIAKLAAAAGLLCCLGLAPGAFAETAQPAAGKTTATTTQGTGTAAKPVDVEADQMEVLDKEKKAIFRGHVVAKRPDVTLNTDEMTVTYADTPQPDGTNKTDVTHIEAKGSVVIVTSREKITGEWATMDPKANVLEVGGKDVTVVQGATVLHGGHLVANLNTHKMEMTGGRVKGSFLPK